MNNHQLWILIRDAYNSGNFYPGISISSYDNWYRIDKYYGDDSDLKVLSLKVLREYSIIHSSCEYNIELMNVLYRQTSLVQFIMVR